MLSSIFASITMGNIIEVIDNKLLVNGDIVLEKTPEITIKDKEKFGNLLVCIKKNKGHINKNLMKFVDYVFIGNENVNQERIVAISTYAKIIMRDVINEKGFPTFEDVFNAIGEIFDNPEKESKQSKISVQLIKYYLVNIMIALNFANKM